jgi:uncharacterized protein YdiU (UPF0061 family)
VRFGNFEIFTARRDFATLRLLTDHTIRTHFPALVPPGRAADAPLPNEVYGQWFAEICRRTAALVLHWMRVGFVHGVMNTDNMSILGLTIDYGPYGWLEGYDPTWTPNTTDASGRRYAYGGQPRVAFWNLVQLGNALVPLTEETGSFERGLESYGETFEAEHLAMVARKLGLLAAGADHRSIGDREADDALAAGVFEVLGLLETDFTLFFRQLAEVPTAADGAAPSDEALLAPLLDAHYDPTAFGPAPRAATLAWLRSYLDRVRALGLADDERRQRMNAVNPRYVLRNYLAQLAIDDAEKGEAGKLYELLEVLRRPYDDQPGHEAFAAKRPEWARVRAGCSMLSCSS